MIADNPFSIATRSCLPRQPHSIARTMTESPQQMKAPFEIASTVNNDQNFSDKSSYSLHMSNQIGMSQTRIQKVLHETRCQSALPRESRHFRHKLARELPTKIPITRLQIMTPQTWYMVQWWRRRLEGTGLKGRLSAHSFSSRFRTGSEAGSEAVTFYVEPTSQLITA
jgi:hypothetical protein